MPNPALLDDFTISDTQLDSSVAFLIFILLIFSLTLSLFIKQSALIVALVWYNLSPSFKNCAEMHNVSRRLLFNFIFGLINSRPNLFLFASR